MIDPLSKSLDPTNPVYPANRAMASLKLQKWQDAEDDATRALRHDPSYQKALFRRAQARDQLGKLDGAEMDYRWAGNKLLRFFADILISRRNFNETYRVGL